MCGIIGEIRFRSDVKAKLDKESLRFIQSRGPDSKGYFEKEDIFLGHTRLSIIDVDQRNNQPFYSRDRNHILVFNGEVYNFEHLKSRISNVLWRTSGDTELVLEYILCFGIKKFCEDAEGMYALALYNQDTNVLSLARDTFGQKPLYYSYNDYQFRFSSSAEACSLAGGFCEDTIQEILAFGFPVSYNTAFEGVKSIPRSTYAILDRTNLSIHEYKRVCNVSYQNLEEAINSAVISTSRSDVEIGCFLSGGVDSSIITAIQAKRQLTKAFTIGIADDEQSDELFIAQNIAQSLGVEHYHLSIGSKQIIENIHSAIYAFDTPIMDASIIPTYIVSEMASKHVKVVLGGDGADELFLGYNRHRPLFMNTLLLKLMSFSSFVQPEILDRLGWKLGVQKLSDKIIKVKKIAAGKSLSDKYFLSLSQSNILEINKQAGIQDLRTLEYDYYLQQNILRKTDVLTMAHGLESRTPYLDTNFTSWVEKNYSQEYLIANNRKQSLYDLRKKLLPETKDLDKIKRGFGLPISDYIRTNKIEDFKDIIYTKTKGVHFEIKMDSMNPYELWNIYVMKKWLLAKN